MHAPAGFGPTIPTSKWRQIHALDNAATGIGPRKQLLKNKLLWVVMACRFIPQKLLKIEWTGTGLFIFNLRTDTLRYPSRLWSLSTMPLKPQITRHTHSQCLIDGVNSEMASTFQSITRVQTSKHTVIKIDVCACVCTMCMYVRYMLVAYMYLGTRRLGGQKENFYITYYAYSCNKSKNDVYLNYFK